MSTNKVDISLPRTYRCDSCGTRSVKLWQERVGTSPRLLCASCAGIAENIDVSSLNARGEYRDKKGRYTKEIGEYVPAIPEGRNLRQWMRIPSR